MVDEPLTLARIAARRRAIEEEEARIARHLEVLKTERADLDAAERVLARFGGEGALVANAEVVKLIAVGLEVGATAKPPNTPTITTMIVEALKDARSKGTPGLEPREMTEYIAGRWWPKVPGVAISPIAWRMWKRGQLEKDGAIYKLPTEGGDNSPRRHRRRLIASARKPAPGGGT